MTSIETSDREMVAQAVSQAGEGDVVTLQVVEYALQVRNTYGAWYLSAQYTRSGRTAVYWTTDREQARHWLRRCDGGSISCGWNPRPEDARLIVRTTTEVVEVLAR